MRLCTYPHFSPERNNKLEGHHALLLDGILNGELANTARNVHSRHTIHPKQAMHFQSCLVITSKLRANYIAILIEVAAIESFNRWNYLNQQSIRRLISVFPQVSAVRIKHANLIGNVTSVWECPVSINFYFWSYALPCR